MLQTTDHTTPDITSPEASPDLSAWARFRSEAIRTERRDAAENRQRILATARALFDRHGVDAVTMHDIARAAGVGQGTLYRRYAHKGRLCQALLEDSLDGLCLDLAAIVDAHPAAEPTLSRLEQVIVRLVAFNEANAPLLGGVWDAACGARRADCYLTPWATWLHEAIVTLLQRAAGAGEIPPLDADCTAYALLASAFDGNLYLFLRQERGFSQERITDSLRRLITGLRMSNE
ncbi:MAG: TetR/AcrR family transcriptional regulator [Dehalococcoidia bacterium]